MTDDTPDTALFLLLETSLHRPEVRSSPRLVGDLLADGFVEFGQSGRVFNRPTIIAALAGEATAADAGLPVVSDFSVVALAADVVLVTYQSTRPATETQAGRQTLRSSIWKRRDDRWQMAFHQGTVVPPA